MSSMVAVEKKVLNAVHDAAIFQRRVRVLSQCLAAEFGASGSVLDLGCGDGSLACAIMARTPGLRFRGIDVLIRPRTAIPVELFDGVTIPAADQSYDWVTIVDVLHHADDPARLVAEGHDVRLPYNYLSRKEWDALFRKVGVAPLTWRTSLSLYPFPATLLFDRGLHFIATLR